MRPLMRGGRFALTEKIPINAFRPGDLIAYRDGQARFIHRVWRTPTSRDPFFCVADDTGIIPLQHIPPTEVIGRPVSRMNGGKGLLWGKTCRLAFAVARVLQYHDIVRRVTAAFLFTLCLLSAATSALAANRMKTVEWNYGLGCTTGGVASGATVAFPYITFRLPDCIGIRNAWLELDGFCEGGNNNAINGIDICFDRGTTAGTVIDDFPAATIVYGKPGEGIRFHVKCAVPVSVFSDPATLNNYAAAVKLTSSSSARFNMLALKLCITYEYNDTAATQLSTVRFPLKSATTTASVAGKSDPGTISFGYDAEIAEQNSAGFSIKQQWFELRGHRLSGTGSGAGVTTDGTIAARIGSTGDSPAMCLDGSLIDSYDFLYLTSTASVQSGFTVNDANQIMSAVTAGTCYVYNLGGECVVTYEYSYADTPTRTKTVYYPIGQALTTGNNQFSDINLTLDEDGVSLKALYARCHGTFNGTSSTGTVTWNYSLNGVAGSVNQYLFTQPAQVGNHPFFLDFWGASPAVNWTNGCAIGLSYTVSNAAATGPMGAELVATYQYTASSAKFTDSYRELAYQQIDGIHTSTSSYFSISSTTVESPEGKKFRRSGYLSSTFLMSANSKTTTTGYSITQSINSLSSQAHAPQTSTANCFTTALYCDPLSLLSYSTATLTADASISATGSDVLFANSCANVTYSYFPPPGSPQSLTQYTLNQSSIVPAAGWINTTSAVLQMRLSSRMADSLTPVVEIKPLSAAFNGTSLVSGAAVNYAGSGTVIASVTVSGLTEGTTYHWRARATSSYGTSLWQNFGNNEETDSDFGVDLSSPSVLIAAPLNGAATGSSTVVFNWSGTDAPTMNSGIASYTLQVSTGADFTALAYSSVTAKTALSPLLNHNTYFWRLRAADNAGNIGDWTMYSLLVDTTPPSTPLLSLPLTSCVTNQLTLAFQWSAADDSGSRGNAGVYGYELFVSTAVDFSVFTASGFVTTPSLSVTLPRQDSYYWRVRAIDNVRNIGAFSDARTLVIDTTPPSVPTLTSPLTDSATNYAAVPFSWAAVSDASTGNSGIKYYELQVSTGALFATLTFSTQTTATGYTVSLPRQSTYYWQVRAADNAGNASEWSSPYLLLFDTSAPTVSLNSSADSQQAPARFRNADPGTGYVDIDFFDTPSRLNQIRYMVSARQDGTGTTIVPWTDIAVSPANTSGYLDNWTIPWASLQEGVTNYVHLYCSDRAGNGSYTWGQFDILKDTTPPPAPSLTAPADAALFNARSVAFDWSDSADLRSGTSFYMLQLSLSADFASIAASSQTAFTYASLSNIDENRYYWRVYAVDAAGNTSLYSSTSSFTIDLSSPTMSVGAGLAGGDSTQRPWNDGTYDVDFHDTGGAGLDRFEISVSTEKNRTAITLGWTPSDIAIAGSSDYTADWQLKDAIWQSLVLNATSYVSLRTFDLIGNVSTYIDAFYVLKVPNPMHIAGNETAGADAVWHSTSTERVYNVDFFTSPGHPLLGVEYTAYTGSDCAGQQIFDWTPVPSITPGTTFYTTDWQIDAAQFAQLPDGSTGYFSVRCWDDSGSTVTLKDAFFVKKDTTPPSIAAVVRTPANGTVTNSAAPSFNWTAASDLASGTTLYYLQVSTAPSFDTLTFSSCTIALSVTAPTLSQATYYWTITAKDLAGNWSPASSAWTVCIDTTPPSVPLLSSPLADFATNYPVLPFVWSAATDAETGLKEYELQVSTGISFSTLTLSSTTVNCAGIAELPQQATYFWQVRAIDAAGNSSSWSPAYYLLYDTSAPTVECNSVADTRQVPPLFRNSDPGAAAIDIDFADQISRLDKVQYMVSARQDGTGTAIIPWTDITAAPVNSSGYTDNWAIPWASLQEGVTNYVHLYCLDRAGNGSYTWGQFDILKDTTPPPAPSLTAPADAALFNARSVAFDWSDSADLRSGTSFYMLQLSLSADFASITASSQTAFTYASLLNIDENRYYWRVYAVDAAGNTSLYSSTGSFTMDLSSPTMTVGAGLAGGDSTKRQWNDGIYDVDFHDTGGAGLDRFEISVSSEPGRAALVLDWTASEVAITGATEFTDDWHLKDAVWQSLVISATSYISLRTFDLAGNTSEYIDAFFIRKIAPSNPMNIVSNEAVGSDEVWHATSTGRAYDVDFFTSPDHPLLGVQYTAYTNTNQTGQQIFDWAAIPSITPGTTFYTDNWQVGAGEFFQLPDGATSYFSVRCWDDSGSTVTLRDAFFVKKDTTPPSVSALVPSPTDGAMTNTAAVPFSWSAAADLASGTTLYFFEVSTGTAFATVTFSSYTAEPSVTAPPLASTSYYWFVRAKDTAGNWSPDSGVWSLTIDTMPPAVPALSSPLTDFATNYAAVPFAWAAVSDAPTGNSGIKFYELQVSTGTLFATLTFSTQTAATGYTVSLPQQSTYYWQVRAADNAGNASNWAAPFVLLFDTSAPAVSLNSSADSQQAPARFRNADPGTGYLDIDFFDTPARLNQIRYMVSAKQDGTGTTIVPWTDITASPVNTSGYTDNWTIPWASLQEGVTNYVHLYCSDRAGNGSYTWGQFDILKDTTPPPASSLTAPADATLFNARSVAFDWSDSADLRSGTSFYMLQLSLSADFASITASSQTALSYASLSNIDENRYYWRVYAVDAAGNSSLYSSTSSFTIDLSSPTMSVGAGLAGGDSTQRPWNDGTYDVDFHDTGGAGLDRFEISVSTEKNRTAITLGWTPSDVVLSGSSDYTADWQLMDAIWQSLVLNATSYVSLRTFDLAGNTSTYIDAFFILKTPSPMHITNNETAGADAVWRSTSTERAYDVDFFTSPGHPLLGVEYAAYTGSDYGGQRIFDWTPIPSITPGTTFYTTDWQIGAAQFAQLPDGSTGYFSVRCWDDSGSTVTLKDAFFVKKDTTPPSIATLVRAPANGTITNVSAPSFSWTAASDLASGTTLYYLLLSTGPSFATVAYSSCTSALSITVPPLASTSFYWFIRAKDAAGNWSSDAAVWSLTVDTIPPATPALSSPLSDAATNYPVQTFQWTAVADEGPAGLLNYRLELSTANDFSPVALSSTTLLSSATVTMTQSASFYWHVLAFDGAGNCGTSSPRMIIIDTMAPAAAAQEEPADAVVMSSASVTFTWSAAADAGPAGVSAYLLQVSTNNAFTPVWYATATALTAHTTSFIDNIYHWRVRPKDRAGNYALTWSIRSFTLDRSSPPVTALLYPPDDTRIGNLSPYFNWQAVSDAGPSGIARYELIISTDAGFGVISYSSMTALATSTITFTASDIYYWKVRAVDTAGNYAFYTATYSVTIDTTAPVIVVNQAGDDNWCAAPGSYDVDFFDAQKSGNAGLQTAQYRVFSSSTPAGTAAGTELITWQPIFTEALPSRTTSYTASWTLSSGWESLNQGTNFVFVRAADLAGNAVEPDTYAFYIKKDTAAPTIIDIDAAPAWTNSGRTHDIGFADAGWGVSVASYTASAGGTPCIAWTTIFDTEPQASRTTPWSIDFALLAPGTNYISVRAADRLNNVALFSDEFRVLKDTIAPDGITGMTAAAGSAGGTISLSWAAPSDDTLTDPGNVTMNGYLVKYRTSQFTDTADFLTGGTTFYQAWPPKTPKTVEQYSDGLNELVEGTSYYIGIVGIDKAGNFGPLTTGATGYAAATRIAPSKITNLAGSSPDTLEPGSLELTWSAVGDDGSSTGTASGYIVKYATFPFSAAQWNMTGVSTATASLSWQPSAPGTPEDHVVAGLSPGVTYYLAIKAFDDAAPGANYSVMSDTVQVRAVPTGPANGMLAYGEASSVYPRYFTYFATGTWNGPASANATASTIYWSVLRACPVVRNQKLLGTLSLSNALHLQYWDGTAGSWSSPSLKANISDTAYRPYDIAYEQNSGRAMLVYRSAGSNDVYYEVWSSTENQWVVPQTPLTLGGSASAAVYWVRLEPRPGTNELMLVTLDSAKNIYAYRWNGSAWVNKQLLTSAASYTTYQDFDLAWENTRGDCLVAWGSGKNTAYALWSSTASVWGVVGAAGPSIAAQSGAYWIRLSADRLANSNNIAMASLDNGADWNVSVWNGTSWAAPTELSASMAANTPRLIDIAWEKDTGKCIAVGATSANSLYVTYSVWNGSWGSATTYTTYSLGTTSPLKWLQLTPDPNSNKMVLLGADSGADGSVNVRSLNWTGAAWTGGTSLFSNGSSGTCEFFMMALDRYDGTAPYFVNNQPGDDTWRRANTAAYSVAFHDETGGSLLSRVQVSTGSAGNYAWTDAVTGINAIHYTLPWQLPQTTWDQLPQGKTFISLRLFDGVGNNAILPNAFYVLKDTTPPAITNIQRASTAWYTSAADPGAIASATFTEQSGLSQLATAYYLVYPQANMQGTLVCKGTIFDFSASAKEIQSGTFALNGGHWELLANATNYAALQCYDMAGNSTTVANAFVIWKDTVPPQAITTLSAAPGPFRGTIDLTWMAPGDDGLSNRNGEGAYQIKYATFPIDSQALYSSAGATLVAQTLTPKNPGDTETLTIEGLSIGTTCYFAVTTVDKAGWWSGLSNSTATLPRVDNVYINEVSAGGTAGTDWVELFNSMSSSQTLTGWSLTYGQSQVWSAVEGSSMAAGGYFLISGISLEDTAGYPLELKDAHARTVDSVRWPATSSSESFARIADGNNDYFEKDPTPTAGYANSIATEAIKINEIDYASSRQFIELYNVGTDTPVLAGWTLRNAAGSLFVFTRKIYPQSFTGIDGSSSDDNGKSWANRFGTGGLAAAADQVVLENAAGQVIDRVVWKTAEETAFYDCSAAAVSFSGAAPGGVASPAVIGRKSVDGSSVFQQCTTASYGMKNTAASLLTTTQLHYPVSGLTLPRRFKIELTLGEDFSGGNNDTLWFVADGTADAKSPHVYRLSGSGFNLTSTSLQNAVQTGLDFNDIDGNPLCAGVTYTLCLNVDNAAGAAARVAADKVTYNTALPQAKATDIAPAFINNGATEAVLRLDVVNTYPADTNTLELSSFTVTFTNPDDGTPLTTAEAVNLFSGIAIVADSTGTVTTGTYQSALDTAAVVSLPAASFNLDAGTGSQTLLVTNPDDEACTVVAASTRTYFLTVTMTAAAASAVPCTFRAAIYPGTTDTVFRESISDVIQPTVPDVPVAASSPTVNQPAQPPAGTQYPAPVGTAGSGGISGSVRLNAAATTAFATTGDGKLCALNSDGSPKWTYNAGSAITGSFDPTVQGFETDPYVYIVTQSGELRKLRDNGAGNEVSTVWTKPGLGTITTGIIASPYTSCLYVGTAAGALLQFNKDDPNASDAEWKGDQLSIGGGFTGMPVLDDRNIQENQKILWIASDNGAIYRIDGRQGVTANAGTAAAVFTSPYLMDGFSNSALNSQNIYFGSDDGYFRCRTSANLTTTLNNQWQDVFVGSPIRGSPFYDPSADPRAVFFGADNGKLYKVDYSSGGIYWTFQTRGPLRTMPVTGNNYDIYFGSDDGCFYGLDTRTGQILSSKFPIVTGAEVRGSPTYDSGYTGHHPGVDYIYFGSNDGKVYCIEVP